MNEILSNEILGWIANIWICIFFVTLIITMCYEIKIRPHTIKRVPTSMLICVCLVGSAMWPILWYMTIKDMCKYKKKPKTS